MIEDDTDRRLTQLLEEFGPADPPAGFVRQVMERISLEDQRQIRGRIVPFHKGGIAMTITRKAMWGLAAAAAVVLGVYTFTGFPPVGRGTEGTIGAAQKYQAPQIGDKDVVLGDAAAQEFLQSETFDRLLKDPEARSLLSDSSLQAQLKNADFLRAVRTADVRDALSSQALKNVLKNADARDQLTAELKANLAAQAVNQASANARSAEARAAVAQLMANNLIREAFANQAVARAILDPQFQAFVMSRDLAAGLRSDAFVRALQADGLTASLMNGALATSLARR